jgi:hypothetical protein
MAEQAFDESDLPAQQVNAMEFDVHITERLLKRVVIRRMFRGWPLFLLATTLILVGVATEFSTGPLSTMSAVGLTALGIYGLLYLLHYIRQCRSIADWARLQGAAPVHYVLNDESLRATSNLGATELKWHVFKELREHPDFILLGLSRVSHLTLPTADIPPEALALIRQKFTELRLPIRKA